jgi:hypothetical protein
MRKTINYKYKAQTEKFAPYIYRSFVLLQLYFRQIIYPFSKVEGKTALLGEDVGTYAKNVTTIKFKVVVGM